MKFEITTTINCPNTVYCGNCPHQADTSRGYKYCDIFLTVLNKAKDRPQYVKCGKCLEQIRKQV